MNDSISRQAAIETVKKHYRVDNDLLEVIAYEIEALPSAQLAQDLPNGCTDTISRAAALNALNEYFVRIGKLKRRGLNKGEKAISLDVVGTINSLPPAQPNLSEAYSKAVFTWLMDYQIRAAELKGRYTPYEVLSWVISDWRKENE